MRRFRLRLETPAPPMGLELQAGQAAWRVAKPAVRAAVRVILAGLPKLAAARAEAAADADEIDELVEKGLRRADRVLSKPAARRVATTTSRRASAKADADLGEQLRQAIGVNPLAGSPKLGKLLAARAREHADLITTIPRRNLRQLAEEVRKDFKRGRTVEQIAARIERTYLDTNPRGPQIAQLIARDQVNKLMGAQQEIRQRDLGIKRYVWHHRGDSRVRASHRERGGKVFRWDRPPDGGHPGQAIMCRCHATPYVEDPQALLDKVQAAQKPPTAPRRRPQPLRQAVAPLVPERQALAALEPSAARSWRRAKREQDLLTQADLERLAAARIPAPPKRRVAAPKPTTKSTPGVKRRPLVR